MAEIKKSKVKKSSIKKDARGMLMGRGALEKFKDLIQTIKSEEGIDFGDDAGFDTLLEFYMNCVEEYNAMVNGEGPQFYASTKKSKSVKKGWPQPSESYNRMWEKYVPNNGEADTEFGEMLRCVSRVIYRFYNDGDIYRIGYGAETVNPYLKYLKQCKYYEIRTIADEIARFVQENMSTLKWEMKHDFDGENSMQSEYDALLNKLAQEVDRLCQEKEAEDSRAESEEALYYASTKKSKVAKKEWAEDNYDPVSTEEQIKDAFKSKYGDKEIVKLEYVGTDWEMGSQYWILMYDEGQGTLFDEGRRYSVVTVIDWTYDSPDRGITFNFGAYELHRDVAEDVFNEKVQRESDGTRKMKKSIPSDIDRQLDSMLEELVDLCYNLDDRWVNTAVDAQYELGYRAYDDIRADVKAILDGSNEGKIIGLCEDILQRMDSLGKTKKSIPKSNDTKMSFTENVNKMRVNNYAKTGNINTVMKEKR